MPSVLGNAGLPPQAAFVTLPSGRWKRKDAESAPTCRSRVFVRRATAKAGDRYKKRGLCRRRILRCAGSFFALLALPCRRGSFSAPRGLYGFGGRMCRASFSVCFTWGVSRCGRVGAQRGVRRGPRPAARLRASSAAAGFAPAFPVWRGNGPLPFRNRLPRRCGRLCRSRQADRFLPVLCVSAAHGRGRLLRSSRGLAGCCMGFGERSKIGGG